MHKEHIILIVDDMPENIDVLKGILQSNYNIKVATNGEKAITITNTSHPPDLILLDIMMPGMDGYEVCSKLKKNVRTKNIPIIFVTTRNEIEDEKHGFELGAVDYITKPFNPYIVEARVKIHISLYNQKCLLEHLVRERTSEIYDTRLEIIRRLGRAAEYKDNETGMHVMRMSHYSKLIALEHGIESEEADLILNAAPMHDIGKIGIPDSILLKPGKLDDYQWKVMKTHPEVGAEIIGEHPSVLLGAAKIIALTHHEKWNGKGYPAGLSGADIPLIGRIIAIADVFDALTSERPYKKAWPVKKATNLIKEESGQYFDPDLVNSFFRCLNNMLKVKDQFKD